jgi:NAD(P)-dependent dehydrogenase (short-subunit alcohol dehydrogenase family)
MSGKTVVITGATSGIGRATAVALSKMGAKVFITARDSGRGLLAAETIGRVVARVARRVAIPVELVVFDLGSIASVRKGAADLLERAGRIDVLVNNAGVVLSDRKDTADGLEQTFEVNHLGPFLLTKLLSDRLVESSPSRVVNVASTAHKSARHGLDFDDLQSRQGYRAMKVYSLSKLANMYFTTELARRLDSTGVTANCLHPGTVATGYGRDGDTRGLFALGLRIASPFFMSPEKGALTSVYLASSPEVEGVTGKYFIKCREKKPSKAAEDSEAAKRLWQVSEDLIAQASD